jgi:hypothetical protein
MIPRLPAAAPTVRFSRILNLYFQSARVSRKFVKIFWPQKGTKSTKDTFVLFVRPVATLTLGYILIAARTLLRVGCGVFSVAADRPASMRYINVSHTSLEPVPTT